MGSFEFRIFSFNAGSFFVLLFKFIGFLTLRDFIKFQGVDPNIQNFSGRLFCTFIMFRTAFTNFYVEIIIMSFLKTTFTVFAFPFIVFPADSLISLATEPLIRIFVIGELTFINTIGRTADGYKAAQGDGSFVLFFSKEPSLYNDY